MEKKVLIVDDDLNMARMFATALKAQGYRVETVFGGEAALEAVGAQTFDLVLMDVMMPQVDGMMVLERWPQEALTSRRNVILMSSLAPEALDKQIKKVRVLSYWHKDELSPQNLVEKIKAVLI